MNSPDQKAYYCYRPIIIIVDLEHDSCVDLVILFHPLNILC